MSDGRDNVLQVHAVSRITRLTAVDTVRARISLAIELGLLPPGEKLPSVEEISLALEVSEITARRAMASLTSDGLLVRKRGKFGGTFVAEHPAEGIVDVSAVYREDKITVDRLIDERALIESALVVAAANHASEKDFADLQRHIDEAASATSWAAYHLADEKFHLGLINASGMTWAAETHRRVLSELYRYFVPYPIEYLHESNAEHQRILDAIRAGDAENAMVHCQHHILTLHESMYTGLKPPAPAR